MNTFKSHTFSPLSIGRFELHRTARTPIKQAQTLRSIVLFAMVFSSYLKMFGQAEPISPPSLLSYEVLHSFGYPSLSGYLPETKVIEGSDGALYGTASTSEHINFISDDKKQGGTIFKINKDGSGYIGLYVFDVGSPLAALIEASDGMLYGATGLGGVSNQGTIFKIGKDGANYSVLRHFTNYERIEYSLLEGSDGFLYGIDNNSNSEKAFRITKSGTGYTVIHEFTGATNDTRYVNGPLIEGKDGFLYGTSGRIFRMQKDGSGFSILHTFSSPNTATGALLEGSDGFLYGAGRSRIFKMRKDGLDVSTIVLPSNIGPGAGSLIEGSDGMLYGISSEFLATGCVFRVEKDFSIVETVHGFTAVSPDGIWPQEAVIEGSDGFLYGATYWGGTTGLGCVFKVSKEGHYSTLLSLSKTGGDGSHPNRLIHGSDGAFYGTTYYGGAWDRGTVYKIDSNGAGYSVLHDFRGGCLDGSAPDAELLDGSNELLYGTTLSGGCSNAGTIFSITKNGSNVTVLHSFTRQEGSSPNTPLILGPDGFLYGTTLHGGPHEAGGVFKVRKDGTGFRVLHNFAGGLGNYPINPSPLTLGSDGRLYGTTAWRERDSNLPIIYRVSVAGADYAVLHTFQEGLSLTSPASRLCEATDGFLYGTMVTGYGWIYRISKEGTGFTLVHKFEPYGQYPNEVIQGSDGALYGVLEGFDGRSGILYRINLDGSMYHVVAEFSNSNKRSDAVFAACPIEGLDGKLYGVLGPNAGELGRGLIYVVAPPELSKLEIHMAGENVLVTWPSTMGLGVLESSDSLRKPINWSRSTFMIETNGDWYQARGAASGDSRFFRLRR